MTPHGELKARYLCRSCGEHMACERPLSRGQKLVAATAYEILEEVRCSICLVCVTVTAPVHLQTAEVCVQATVNCRRCVNCRTFPAMGVSFVEGLGYESSGIPSVDGRFHPHPFTEFPLSWL